MRGTGRMLWQVCASFQAVPTAWLGSIGHKDAPVSYTHLTLPTILLV